MARFLTIYFAALFVASLSVLAIPIHPHGDEHSFQKIQQTCVGNTCSVNMFIGTGGAAFGIGHNHPGPQYPFGACRIGPDTALDNVWIQFNHFGGYYYRDTHIRAFSHTRLVGAGSSDFGNIGVMAVTQPVTPLLIRNYGYRSTFSHETEFSTPGFYSVFLETWGVSAEFTATGTHSGYHRYSFPTGKPMIVLIDLCHTITPDACSEAKVSVNTEGGFLEGYVINRGRLSGSRPIQIYFHARLNSARGSTWVRSGIWQDGEVSSAQVGFSTQQSLGAYLDFGIGQADESSRKILLQIGISFVSQENARMNLESQSRGASFDEAVTRSIETWANVLSAWDFQTNSDEDEKTKIYTALYRMSTSPTQYDEHDGTYVGFDKTVQKVTNGQHYYSDLSIWDTFRSSQPWLVLAQPQVGLDIVRSLVNMHQLGGDLPRWPLAHHYTGVMFGDHVNSFIVDAYLKGLQDFNITAAYEGMRLSAMGPRPNDGRGCIEDYLQYGYVPVECSEIGTSLTLGYAFDDAMVSKTASILGIREDAAYFEARSKNYKKIWHPEAQFMCPKYRNGTIFCPKFSNYPFSKYYKEGNAWHYSWFVPHDVPGLVSLYPSVDEFLAKTEVCMQNSTTVPPTIEENYFPNPFYWAGNEHDLFHPWIFNYVNRPDRTQYWSRWLVANKYKNTPGGLPGNDDYGTMSSWLLFASIGFYPNAGADEYVIGSPSVQSAKFTTPTGRILSITTENQSPQNIFVQKVTLNGVHLCKPFLSHQDVAFGGEIHFQLGPSVGPNYGFARC